MPCAKRGPADAHDVGVSGCHSPSTVQLKLMMLGFQGDPFQRGPADAHDAGVSGCHSPSAVQLMLMMLGFRGAIRPARSS